MSEMKAISDTRYAMGGAGMRITDNRSRITDHEAQADKASPEVKAKLTKLKKACQDLEAVFLKDLLTVMRRSIPKSQFGNAPGAGIYEDMFDQAIAESASKSGSFGIGEMLYKKMAPAIERQLPKAIASIVQRDDKNSNETKLDIRG